MLVFFSSFQMGSVLYPDKPGIFEKTEDCLS